MIKKIKIISILLCFAGLCIMFYSKFSISYDVYVQNKIIDDVFGNEFNNLSFDNLKKSLDNRSDYGSSDVSNISHVSSNANDIKVNDSYLGYISIPKFGIRRLIKSGTDEGILNANFVGLYRSSGSLSGSNLIILAGHNVSNVFSKLHSILIGDEVFINSYDCHRKFIVYDKRIVSELDISYLSSNRSNELLLVTCTKNRNERLLVFLKEEL